jgi:DUF1365 family protein
MNAVRHIAGHTWHGRKGAVENAFRYRVDYLLLDAEAAAPRAPRLLARNRAGVMSLHDSDHGGPPGKGRGPVWVREVLDAHGLPAPARIELLAQPRVLGHVFNPVAFWLCHDAEGATRCIIAEVTNTYGDRHSYLCHRDDHGAITATDRLRARKIFHVSPFQPVEGEYEFRFDLRPDRIGIWIDLTAGNGGVLATLTGPVRPLGLRGIAAALLRRPFGSRRVLALIHWQALKLWWKGATFRARPAPPADEVSR